MLSAGIGELSATLMRNPWELIKQNLQIGKFPNLQAAIKNIYKTGGIFVRILLILGFL